MKLGVWILNIPFLSNDVDGLLQNFLFWGRGPVFGTRPFYYKFNTWDVLWYKRLWNLNFSCVKTNIFCSSLIDVTKLWAIFLKFYFEYRMSVSEIQWWAFFSFSLYKILSSHFCSISRFLLFINHLILLITSLI